MTLLPLIKREVKAFLKNPAFIVTIVVIFAFYLALGGIMRFSVEEAQREVFKGSIGLVLGEDTELTRVLVILLNETMGGRVKVYASLREAVKDTGVGIFIPEGFSVNATSRESVLVLNGMVSVESYSSILVQTKVALFAQISSLIERLMPVALSIAYGGEPPHIRFSVNVQGSALFYDKEVRTDLLMAISSVLTTLPILITIVVGSNAGYASQLVAFEKVEKAFEMLLSQPIRRSSIVIAKIVGASLATLLFSAVYIAGLIGMFSFTLPQGIEVGNVSPLEMISEMSRSLGFDLVPAFLTSIAIALVLGLISSGSLGIIMGSLSPDERTASLLTMPIMFLYFGIGFMFMFLGVQLNAVVAILSGIAVVPMPVVYMVSLIIGQPIYALISTLSSILICVLQIAMSVIIFNRDIVILGVKLRWRQKE
ncbi:MAG: ABC transporter permease [Desulfurococcaceae archaeon]